MGPVNILHLVSYSLFSGPMSSTLGLAMAQRQLGNTVWLAYDIKRGPFNVYEEAAQPYFDDGVLTPPVNLVLSTKSSPWQIFRDVCHLRRFIRSGAVDVIHTHLSHDHAVAALAGVSKHEKVRLVRTIHSHRSLKPRFGQKFLYTHASAWIVRCQAHADQLPVENVTLIPGSIDSQYFVPSPQLRAQARARFDLPLDAQVVAHVALMARRGQEELLKALEILGDRAPFVLFVGRGECEKDLYRLVEKSRARARVRFSGYLKGTRLHEAYAAADAAFVAQMGNDASGRPALEAMASGLPVIAVQTGALKDLVDKRVGFPITSREPNEIAAALLQLGDLGERGSRARALVCTTRTFEQEALKTLDVYRNW
jgi:L-malate glycosyltransferase